MTSPITVNAASHARVSGDGATEAEIFTALANPQIVSLPEHGAEPIHLGHAHNDAHTVAQYTMQLSPDEHLDAPRLRGGKASGRHTVPHDNMQEFHPEYYKQIREDGVVGDRPQSAPRSVRSSHSAEFQRPYVDSGDRRRKQNSYHAEDERRYDDERRYEDERRYDDERRHDDERRYDDERRHDTYAAEEEAQPYYRQGSPRPAMTGGSPRHSHVYSPSPRASAHYDDRNRDRASMPRASNRETPRGSMTRASMTRASTHYQEEQYHRESDRRSGRSGSYEAYTSADAYARRKQTPLHKTPEELAAEHTEHEAAIRMYDELCEKYKVRKLKDYTFENSTLAEVTMSCKVLDARVNLQAHIDSDYKPILYIGMWGVEMVNAKLNSPLRLQGLGHAVMSNSTDFDESLREMYKKYSFYRARGEPEIELLKDVGKYILKYQVAQMAEASMGSPGGALPMGQDPRSNNGWLGSIISAFAGKPKVAQMPPKEYENSLFFY